MNGMALVSKTSERKLLQVRILYPPPVGKCLCWLAPLSGARQPILSANWNFLSLPRHCGAGQKRASLIFNWTVFILFVIIFMKG